MNADKSDQLLHEYLELKKMYELPLKIRLYLSTLENLIGRNPQTDVSRQQVVDPHLIKAFASQSQEERVGLLLQIMQRLRDHYENFDETGNESHNKAEPGINSIETSCQMEGTHLKLSHWTTSRFRMDKLRKRVLISNKKKNFVMELENYLVRASKKNKNTIVFVSTSKQVSPEQAKVSLKFKAEIFYPVYKQLFTALVEVLAEELLKGIRNNAQQSMQKAENVNEVIKGDKSLQFLNSEQITGYLKYKNKICQRLMVGGFSFKTLHKEDNGKQWIKVERSTKIDKLFKLECLIGMGNQELKSLFLEAVNTRYKYKLQSNIMEEFSKRYKAVYDKYLLNNRVYEHLCIKEEANTQKEEIYFAKDLANVMTGNYLQFLIAKVKPTDSLYSSRLVVVASIVLGPQITQQIATAFLLEFRHMLDREQKESPCEDYDQDEFYSIMSGEHSSQQEGFDLNEDVQPSSERKKHLDIMIKQERCKPQPHMAFVKRKYVIVPEVMTQEELRGHLLRQHHFKTQSWARGKKGGLICTDQQFLRQQRKAAKKLVTYFAVNLPRFLRTGTLMTASIPVSLFKRASHLQLIANNFSYAPILFDRFQKSQSNHLQMIKASLLFNISVSNLGISFEKPFNPILGETYQCWVGGCPLYLEQISHHPPITSYLLIGRGYRMWGCIYPKIWMNLNSLSCWNHRPHYIQFDNGTKICLKFAKMITSGFLIGDRDFNYEDKSYAYDMTNHIFAVNYFGPNKKAVSRRKEPDYVSAKIYRTTPTFLNRFQAANDTLFPERDDIIDDLGTMQGIWNEAVVFNGSQYMNFSKQLAYKCEPEQVPLPSDSRFRKDLQLWIENNLDESQRHKELLEEIQRRDRKLREKDSKK